MLETLFWLFQCSKNPQCLCLFYVFYYYCTNLATPQPQKLFIKGEEDDHEADRIIPPFNAAEFAPVAIFLAGLGLGDWIKVFERERIDLEALTLLGDSELRTLGLPLGPRMKMLSAIEERRKAMSDEQILQDSQL